MNLAEEKKCWRDEESYDRACPVSAINGIMILGPFVRSLGLKNKK